jgi:hypothetical protein
VHHAFRAEFKVGRDQTPLGDAPYLVKRRGGIWANAHVYVTSHYLCLRQRLFRMTTRETLSLFDVTEMVSNERGDLLVCATELDRPRASRRSTSACCSCAACRRRAAGAISAR